jgi:hypothetical protein
MISRREKVNASKEESDRDICLFIVTGLIPNPELVYE